MKEKFEALELDVVRFENEDIITLSIGCTTLCSTEGFNICTSHTEPGGGR